jgi:predicted nucleic-acid-binding Zn-ribbon protein
MSTDDRQPCPQCGALNYAADDICVSCGYDLPPPGQAEPADAVPPPTEAPVLRPCPKCGVRHYDTDTTCFVCGTAFDGYRPRRDPWGMTSVLLSLGSMACFGLWFSERAPALDSSLWLAAWICSLVALVLALVSWTRPDSTWGTPALGLAIIPMVVMAVYVAAVVVVVLIVGYIYSKLHC